MKTTIFFATILCILQSFAGNVTFYKTYEDFKVKKGENGGEFLSASYTIGSGSTVNVTASVNGKQTIYDDEMLKKYWGTEIDGIIYRFVYVVEGSTYSYDLAEIVIESPNLVVYESISSRIGSINAGRQHQPGKYPSYVFISKGITAELKSIHFNLKSKIRSVTREAFPEYINIFDCIDEWKKNNIDRETYQSYVMDCFRNFIKNTK